jgi:hypothetical protein
MQALRYLYAAVAVVFVVGVAIQVFLAGMFLFADGSRDTHIEFGYTLTLVPIVVVVLAALARPGWRHFGLAALLLVDTWLQPTLVYFQDSFPFVAALHPVNAMLLFGLGILVARRAIALARSTAANGAVAVPHMAPEV